MLKQGCLFATLGTKVKRISRLKVILNHKAELTYYKSKLESTTKFGVFRRVELDGGNLQRVWQQDVACNLHTVAERVRQEASVGG